MSPNATIVIISFAHTFPRMSRNTTRALQTESGRSIEVCLKGMSAFSGHRLWRGSVGVGGLSQTSPTFCITVVGGSSGDIDHFPSIEMGKHHPRFWALWQTPPEGLTHVCTAILLLLRVPDRWKKVQKIHTRCTRGRGAKLQWSPLGAWIGSRLNLLRLALSINGGLPTEARVLGPTD